MAHTFAVDMTVYDVYTSCVRTRVCGLVCICMYTSIVDFTC